MTFGQNVAGRDVESASCGAFELNGERVGERNVFEGESVVAGDLVEVLVRCQFVDAVVAHEVLGVAGGGRDEEKGQSSKDVQHTGCNEDG